MSPSKIFLSEQSTAKKTQSSSASSITFSSPSGELEEEGDLIAMVDGEGDDTEEFVLNGKSLRSSVWKYATKLTAEVAQCDICRKQIKTASGGTTSLRKHLLRQHRVSDLTSYSRSSEGTANRFITKRRKNRLDHFVKIAIFEDGRPFADFRKKGMPKFLAEAVPGE